MKRHELSDLRAKIKSASGRAARVLLLAYALLRDVPYRVCEPVTAPLPDEALDYFRKILAYGVAEVATAHAAAPVSKAAVLAWLAVPETEAHRAERCARADASAARTTAARAAFRDRVLAVRAAS